MKKTILISLLFINALTLNAQNSDSNKTSKFKTSFGLQVGFSSGYGLSHRLKYEKIELMTVFSPSITKSYTLYSAGLTMFRTINKGKKSSLFLYSGLHYHQFKNYYGSKKTKIRLYENYVLGSGYGVKIMFSKKVYLSLQIGLAFDYYKDNQYNISFISPDLGYGIFHSL